MGGRAGRRTQPAATSLAESQFAIGAWISRHGRGLVVPRVDIGHELMVGTAPASLKVCGAKPPRIQRAVGWAGKVVKFSQRADHGKSFMRGHLISPIAWPGA